MKKTLTTLFAVILTGSLSGCAPSSDSPGLYSGIDSAANALTSAIGSDTEPDKDNITYNATIHINFISNLLFSTYDVEVSLDGVSQGKLGHGEDADFEFELETGEHSLSFTSSDSSDVNGSVLFAVSDDIEASFKISCHSSEIDVEEEYLINKNTIGENEAIISSSASEYKNKDYMEVVQSLEEAGFTNISTQAVYDIVWGVTDEGTTDEISIGGNNTFKKGDVFKKDIEIVVKYHLKEKDDPSNLSGSESSSSSTSSEKPESNSSSTSSEKPESSSSSTENIPVVSMPISTSSMSDEDIPYAPAETQTTGIELISMTNPLRRNEDAQITIKGAPNTEYRIDVYYSSGRSTADGLENKVSDSEGYVTWTWHVGGRTKLGDNKRVEIKGGGQTLKTTFSVVN